MLQSRLEVITHKRNEKFKERLHCSTFFHFYLEMRQPLLRWPTTLTAKHRNSRRNSQLSLLLTTLTIQQPVFTVADNSHDTTTNFHDTTHNFMTQHKISQYLSCKHATQGLQSIRWPSGLIAATYAKSFFFSTKFSVKWTGKYLIF